MKKIFIMEYAEESNSFNPLSAGFEFFNGYGGSGTGSNFITSELLCYSSGIVYVSFDEKIWV